MTPSVQILSASAGTGKTTRLATLLEEEIRAGKVRPHAVLATTFTRRAAAELQERVRERLLRAGLAEAAQELAAARIGTVHSLCGGLVGQFALDLGLPPDLAVLDEEGARRLLVETLGRTVLPEEYRELEELETRFDELPWESWVQALLEKARTNALSPDDLARSARQSQKVCRELLSDPWDESELPARHRELAEAIEALGVFVRTGGDETRKTEKAQERCARSLRILRHGQTPPWREWAALSRLDTAKAAASHGEKIRRLTGSFEAHPRLHADLSRVIELVSDLAARTLEAFQTEKARRGVLDFVDQQVRALALLSRTEVAAVLAEEVDLVLVDEFQDTSPLQLALFLRLAEIVGRSVWVGDQKQAIYGFRDCDPALMDAVLATLESDEPVETLDRSYRSRPGLVHLTSSLFASVFPEHGIPEERVHLDPALETEPPGLGAALEAWHLVGKNQTHDRQAVATGVRALLEDPSVRVRDPRDGSPRAARPEDVAVLCRRNATCIEVARALEDLGLPVSVERPGLLSTLEVRVALAGLVLWRDPRDALARAELARLLDHPEDGEAWLADLLAAPGAGAFEGAGWLDRVGRARKSGLVGGPVVALDLVVEALDLRELCLGWGRCEERLGNLEALRSHAVRYASARTSEGLPADLGSFLAELDRVAARGEDTASARGEGAVTVCTWHGAKGLEWPITVLFDLQGARDPSALGIHVVAPEGPLDLEHPLAGRWIRVLPDPFHRSQRKTRFHERLREHPVTLAARERAERESLRLLYMGWTRARDRLVLAARAGKHEEGLLAVVPGPEEPLDDHVAETIQWCGVRVPFLARTLEPTAPDPRAREAGHGHDRRGRDRFPPARIPASSLRGRACLGAPVSVGERLQISGCADMHALGEALHGFLAADDPALAGPARRELAAKLLRRWEVEPSLGPVELLRASDGLRAWVEERWPEAVWYREWPVARRLPEGTQVHGVIDLLLDTPGGLVVIEHKSFPGSWEQVLSRADGYTGQIQAYADAIRVASGRPVLASFLHLPVSGRIVPLLEHPETDGDEAYSALPTAGAIVL